MKPSPAVAIVGSGIGGLVCALQLAAAGSRVTLFERANQVGGKMRTATLDEPQARAPAPVDAGPTVLTMRWVFDELFEAVGERLEQHLTLEPAAVLARHAWSDGVQLDLHADPEASRRAIADVFGEREGRAYAAYLEDGRRIYDAVLEPFLRSQRPTLAGVVRRSGLTGLRDLTRIDAFRSMWSAIAERFTEPRLRQLFGRYATYCGSSPFDAPATLNLIAFVEGQGVYRVRGGMSALRDSLATLARARGVEIRLGAHVEEIVVRRGRAAGVLVAGEIFPADAVVFNGDVGALGSGLVGHAAASAVKPTAPGDRSLSALTWATVARARGIPLVHHNVFFSDDYGAEFDDLLRKRRAPARPTVYVCAEDRADTSNDLDEERMLVVVNAPATGDDPKAWSEAEKLRCEEATVETMRRCGLALTMRATERTTPLELERMFPGTGGALYGPVSRGALSGLSRAGARSKLTGLYLAGGSVHPGPGVPMAALSGRRAAERILEDLGSTTSFRMAGMPGTTSMG